MSTAWWVRLGGVLPASEIAPHSQPTFETQADGGCTSASFELALTARSQHQLLRKDTLVEIMCGPLPMWTGELTEPDRTSWEVHAQGLSTSLRDYLALDASGNATRNVEVAINQAALRGWKGRNPYGVGIATTVPGDVGEPIKVGQLLDELCEWYPGGLRWGVDRTGSLYTRTPGVTEPRWMAMPDATAFGVTTENTPRRLAGRFFDGTNNVTAWAGTGAPEESVNLEEWGTLTLAQAQAILAGKIARNGVTGWVNGASLSSQQLRTLAGTPAFLGMVRGGQGMRAHGLPYTATQALYLDVEIGKTTYTAGDDVIQLEPVNTAPRNFVDVTAAS